MRRLAARLAAGVLSAVLVCLWAMPAALAVDPFTDIADSYAREAILALQAEGKVQGVGDGLFAPRAQMTREQFAAILVRVMSLDEVAGPAPFTDNADPAAWYYGAVNTAWAHGLMIGLDDSTFGVGQPISREQAVVTLVRVAGLEPQVDPQAVPGFADAHQLSPWSRGYVALAQAKGLIVGMGDNTFAGSLEMTREMAVQMLYRALTHLDEGARMERAIGPRAAAVLHALEQADLAGLADLVHPVKGVRFSPYAFVDVDRDQVLLPEQLRELDPAQVFLWGYYDGSGHPIEMTFPEYLRSEFVYGRDYMNAPEVAFDQVLGRGNTINNIREAYPEGHFVEYHFPGTPEMDGMDWSSLRLVFEEIGGQWYLVGVIGDRWTI